jgi:membrane-associated phospholipid phosphatase
MAGFFGAWRFPSGSRKNVITTPRTTALGIIWSRTAAYQLIPSQAFSTMVNEFRPTAIEEPVTVANASRSDKARIVELDYRAGREWMIAAVVLAALAVVVLPWDTAIARRCRPDAATGRSLIPRDIGKFLTLAEVYSHGAGVFSIVVTLLLCDPTRRGHLPRLLAASYGSGLAANAIKMLLIARQRPSAADLTGDSWSTFVAWFPLLSERFATEPFTRSFQSCPSAHSATAAGLTVALSVLHPRGRWWFAFLGAACLCQRVESGAHFPSDTLFGAALGCVVGALLMNRIPAVRRPGRLRGGVAVPQG